MAAYTLPGPTGNSTLEEKREKSLKKMRNKKNDGQNLPSVSLVCTGEGVAYYKTKMLIPILALQAFFQYSKNLNGSQGNCSTQKCI